MKTLKPVRLKVSGFNSFIEPQEIDFSKLTERGLFGIFGPTGSGKSTILDAITMAMYGGIPRNTSEFINTQCDIANITYEFEIGSGKGRKKYIIDRSVKRDTQKNGYNTKLARLCEVSGEEIKVIAEKTTEVNKKIVELIGLTSEDFTRSVVLPQGKFNDFLKLSGKDRRDMLERIFGLEKYGIKLVKKIKNAKYEKNIVLQNIEGQLSRFNGVNEELHLELKNKLSGLSKEEKYLKEEKQKLDIEFQNLQKIWEKQQELEDYQEKKKELDRMLEEINEKRIMLKNAQRALEVMPHIENIKETKKKIEKSSREVEDLKNQLTQVEKKLRDAESQYKIAYDKKEKELPLLIEKSTKLQQAIIIEEELKKVKAERDTLVEEYKKNKGELQSVKGKIQDLNDIKEKITDRLMKIDDRIKKINFNPDFRQRLLYAYDIEKESSKLGNEKADRISKINQLSNDVEIKKKDHNKLLFKIGEISEKIRNCEEKQKILLENCPGNNEILFEKHKHIENLKQILKECVEDVGKKRDIETQLKTACKEIYEYENMLLKIKDDITIKENEYETLKNEIEKLSIENLAGMLVVELKEGKPCPLCGSKEHPMPATGVDEGIINEKKDAENILLKEIKSLESTLIKLQTECLQYKAKEDVLKKDLEILNDKLINVDVQFLQNQLFEEENNFNKLRESIEKWNKDKEEIENCIINLKEEKAEEEKEEARISEGIKKDELQLNILKNEVEIITKEYEIQVNELKDLKLQLGVEDIKVKLDELTNNEKEIKSLNDEGEQLRKEQEKIEKERELLEGKTTELSIALGKIEESGKEKKQVIETQMDKINDLSEGRIPAEYIVIVKEQMDSINSSEVEFKKKLDEVNFEFKNINERYAGLLENLSVLMKISEEQKQKLETSLKENEFISILDAEHCYKTREEIKEIELRIKDFDNQYLSVNENINRINSALNGKLTSKDEWEDVKLRVNEISNMLDIKTMEIGAVKQQLKEVENNLKIVNELIKQRNEVTKVLEQLEDIDKLVQGNKFVAFVALSQLKYIAMEASKRLKDITKGRYALELDVSGNFIMRDDFNGGTRRATDTLSGGEIFLTSLSLALALSSQIQLRGNAPLEFFFLDEGFGTLDAELLDTVMTSLERLHSDRLSVGIISHVEELKNRVPVKLLVHPAKQGGEGSKVQIEYS